MTENDAFDIFLKIAHGSVIEHGFLAALREEAKTEQIEKALQNIIYWYETGTSYGVSNRWLDISSFVSYHRMACVWAVMLSKEHDSSERSCDGCLRPASDMMSCPSCGTTFWYCCDTCRSTVVQRMLRHSKVSHAEGVDRQSGDSPSQQP